jgi:TRAP-type C4-dicarboxylate transport system permease small subunit
MAEIPSEPSRRKWVEPVVAVLMALTTLCTAWCSYESAAWTRQSTAGKFEQPPVRLFAAFFGVAVFIFAVIRMLLMSAA